MNLLFQWSITILMSFVGLGQKSQRPCVSWSALSSGTGKRLLFPILLDPLENKKKYLTHCDPASPCLAIYPKETTYLKTMYTPKLVAP